MALVSRYAHSLGLVLLLAFLSFALPPGFDPVALRFLVPGFQQLRRGDQCVSSSQCGGFTCCLARGNANPTCQPAARLGHLCSRLTSQNLYFQFCPCQPGAHCHPRRRRCIPS
ncbi:uncharacterized protein LOC142765425 [Rhipicephalus microplus]|uniref:uncharacterized protein LOC142765425 n=1 Tax=Rhipicephalus microplus TaxID=6941 RepID=UPI003F6BD47D